MEFSTHLCFLSYISLKSSEHKVQVHLKFQDLLTAPKIVKRLVESNSIYIFIKMYSSSRIAREFTELRLSSLIALFISDFHSWNLRGGAVSPFFSHFILYYYELERMQSEFVNLTDTRQKKIVRYTAGVALGRHFAPHTF